MDTRRFQLGGTSPRLDLELEPGTGCLFADLQGDLREPHRRRLLELVGRDFPESEACAHWHGIVRTRGDLRRALGREVSVVVAALDYFTCSASPAPQDLRVLSAATLEDLRGLLRTDPLTGTLNRRGLDSHLEREVARAQRSGEPLATLACDLDHFKQTNDQHGHPWGDMVLRRLATLLLGHCRASDAVARLGGDEFLVMLPATGVDGALALAQRIHDTLGSTDLLSGCPTLREGEVRLTVSIGVASGVLEGPELISRADAALYRAKRAGRGRSAA